MTDRPSSPSASRAGRRPGESGTRAAILAAATERFTRHGFQATTLRAVAADAEVDPALVHHFFGTKDQLFVAAMELPFDPAELIPRLLAPGLHGLGERLVTAMLATLRGGSGEGAPAQPMLGLIRSSATHPAAAAMMREFLVEAVLGRIAAAVEADRPQLRAALCGSQIVGLIMAREVIGLPPLTEAADAELARIYGAVLQHYLTDALD